MQIIKQLNDSDINWLTQQLQAIALQPDISQYAKNRQRAWLNGLGEPHLSYPFLEGDSSVTPQLCSNIAAVLLVQITVVDAKVFFLGASLRYQLPLLPNL